MIIDKHWVVEATYADTLTKLTFWIFKPASSYLSWDCNQALLGISLKSGSKNKIDFNTSFWKLPNFCERL